MFLLTNIQAEYCKLVYCKKMLNLHQIMFKYSKSLCKYIIKKCFKFHSYNAKVSAMLKAAKNLNTFTLRRYFLIHNINISAFRKLPKKVIIKA